jgi:hypothetical protein
MTKEELEIAVLGFTYETFSSPYPRTLLISKDELQEIIKCIESVESEFCPGNNNLIQKLRDFYENIGRL